MVFVQIAESPDTSDDNIKTVNEDLAKYIPMEQQPDIVPRTTSKLAISTQLAIKFSKST